MNGRERGFTLIEILIAIAISVIVGAVLLRTTAAVLHWSALTAQRDAEHAAMAQLLEDLASDEDAAWAIFTPSSDVRGASNADGHEVDFFARDGKGDARFWAYDYAASLKTITRYLYDAPGGTPRIDVTYAGITRFFAQTYPVTALQDPASKIYSPLFAGAALQPGSVSFYPGTPIAGGNQITYVSVGSDTLAHELELSTQSAPSGFVVVLQYTPAPAPTKAAALQSWPQYIELPLAGQALQTSWIPPPRDVAYYVNRLLGGGIADAALAPCATDQGRAFTDATFTAPLTNAHAPSGAVPSGVNASTDASGCISFTGSTFTNGMPNVALYEPGYTGAFRQQTDDCGAAIAVTTEYPYTGVGPDVQLMTRGATVPIGQCAMSWKDVQQSSTSTSTTYEISGCSSAGTNRFLLIGNGASCNASFTVPSASTGDCGETPRSVILISGNATAAGKANYFTVTRNGAGTIIVNASWDEKWTNSNGRGCNARLYNGTVEFDD